MNRLPVNSPYEGVALVLENSDLLNVPEVCECLLEEVLAKPICDPATVDCAVGGAALVVHLVEGEWLGIGWNRNRCELVPAEKFILSVFTEKTRLDIVCLHLPPILQPKHEPHFKPLMTLQAF